MVALPRGTWRGHDDRTSWTYEVDRAVIEALPGGFAGAVDAAIAAMTTFALVGRVSVTTLSKGEDALVEKLPSLPVVTARPLVAAMLPADVDVVVIDLDLLVNSIDGAEGVVPFGGELVVNNRYNEGPMRISVRVFDDLHAPLSGGLLVDNVELARVNGPRLTRFLATLRTSLNARYTPDIPDSHHFFTADGYAEQDLAALRAACRAAWTAYCADPDNRSRRDIELLLASNPGPSELDDVFSLLSGPPGLRPRVEAYLADLRRPLHPGSESDLMAAAASFRRQLLAVAAVHEADEGAPPAAPIRFVTAPESDPASVGNRVKRRIRTELDEADVRHPWWGYLRACGAVSANTEIMTYLGGLLLPEPIDLTGGYQLWHLGGACEIRADETVLWRLDR